MLPSLAAVQSTKSACESVAIRAEQREVGRVVIAPIAVNVLNLDGNPARDRMSFCPTAFAASFSEF